MFQYCGIEELVESPLRIAYAEDEDLPDQVVEVVLVLQGIFCRVRISAKVVKKQDRVRQPKRRVCQILRV